MNASGGPKKAVIELKGWMSYSVAAGVSRASRNVCALRGRRRLIDSAFGADGKGVIMPSFIARRVQCTPSRLADSACGAREKSQTGIR